MDPPSYVKAPPERSKPRLPKSNEGLFSPRRLLIVAVLAAGIAFAVYAFGRAPAQRVTAPASDPAVEQYLPSTPTGVGTHVLQQAEVGVKLRNGYDGRITINGVTVPEDEMDGAIPRNALNYDPALGVRPNNKNLVAFKPGPGKVFTKLPTPSVTIVITFWRVATPQAKRTITWQLSTT